MEVQTNHHNGDKTVKFASGREDVRIPSGVVKALSQASGIGTLRKLYLHTFADFFIGGWIGDEFLMESEWADQWDSRQMFGEYKLYISTREFGELLCGFHPNYKRELNFPSSIESTFGRINARATRPFVRFKQQRGHGRLYEVAVDSVAIGGVNERIKQV